MNNLNPFTLTKEQYQELYQEVLLFAKIGGVVNDEEGIWKMCLEEHSELMLAIREGNKILTIDSVCDQFVTFVQLHHHYMSKPTWEQPITSAWIDNNYGLLEELEERNEAAILPLIHYWLISAKLQAEILGFSLYKAIKEVNRSNMTKFPSELSIINRYNDHTNFTQLAAEECEELSNGKYKNVWAKCASYETDHKKSHVVVFRENFGNGKICKAAWAFEEPDFTHCLLENEV